MKRTLSVLLALVLFLSALPLTALAAETDVSAAGTHLYTANVTIEEPVPGKKPDRNPQIPEGAANGDLYKVKDVEWSGELDDEGRFIADKTYGLEITLTVIDENDEWYAFVGEDESSIIPLSGTINGKEVDIEMGGRAKTISMNTYFYCENKPIDAVEVTGVAKPMSGQYDLSVPVVPDNAGYMIDGIIKWYEADTDAEVNSRFEGGKVYTCKIYLIPGAYGRHFTDEPTGTINGKNATVSVLKPNERIVMSYTFTCHGEDEPVGQGEVSRVEVMGVTEPVAGAAPTYSATVPSGKGYQVDDLTTETIHHGVQWYNRTNGKPMTESDTFESGKHYAVYVSLKPADSSHSFASYISGTLNGTDAEIVDYGDGTIRVYYAFERLPAVAISSVEVTGVVEPVAGAAPSYSADVSPLDKYYEVDRTENMYYAGYLQNGVGWYNDTDKKDMTESDTFESGKQYTVLVFLKTINDNYSFASRVSGTVNGLSASISRYGGGSTIKVSRTFTCPNQPKPLASVSCTVTEPVAGQNPDYTAVPADSTKYTATIGDWIYGTGRTARTMTADETFIEGKTYQVQVKFTAKRGYYLTDDTFYLINGKAANKITVRGVDYYVVTFTASAATIAVTDVSVTDLIEPVAGAAPTYSASVPAGSGYHVEEDFTDGTWVNGVLWHNDTDNKDMTENDTFEADKQYTATVLLESAAGYSFASNISATLNGKDAEVRCYSSSSIGVYRAFTCTESSGATLSGTATSYLSDSEPVTIELVQGVELKYSTTVTGNNASYSIPNVEAGTYTLWVMKKNHVKRSYKTVVNGDTTKDVKICPIGDATNDGKVNMFDYNAVYKHVARNPELAEGSYQKACADVTGDGKVNMFDYNAIYKHVAKTKPLWTE